MNSELNNQQTDWLAQTEELNDTEASQVNGGATYSSSSSSSSSNNGSVSPLQQNVYVNGIRYQ
jgi:hypothetical protein